MAKKDETIRESGQGVAENFGSIKFNIMLIMHLNEWNMEMGGFRWGLRFRLYSGQSNY
jgi:hypothetical protein